MTSLLGFNLGVELGQGAAVIGILPLARWLGRRESVRQGSVRVGSSAVLAGGAFWMVQRVLG